jgi:hypothetical protein
MHLILDTGTVHGVRAANPWGGQIGAFSIRQKNEGKLTRSMIDEPGDGVYDQLTLKARIYLPKVEVAA